MECFSSYVVFRCEDLGKELKVRGTKTHDAICGDFKSRKFPFLPLGRFKRVSPLQILKYFSFK